MISTITDVCLVISVLALVYEVRYLKYQIKKNLKILESHNSWLETQSGLISMILKNTGVTK